MKSQLFIALLLLASLALLPGLSLTDSDDNDLSSVSSVHPDRSGPPTTLIPVWHESDGGWIEARRGERVWTHDLDAPVSANTTDEGLHLQVLNQHGEPAVSAWVEAYPPESEWPEWEGYTNDAGQAEVAVMDGIWTLVIASENDHFVIIREAVSTPGSLTLDTTGAVPVKVTAYFPDGQPLSGAEFSFERFVGGYNKVGSADSEGCLQIDVSPGTYCGLAISRSERYYLNRPGVTVSNPTTVTFEANQMGTGQVVMRLPDLAQMGLNMLPVPWCRSWSPVFFMADEDTAVLSADRYELGIDFILDDCTFAYDVKDTPHNILAGSVTTMWAGGMHVASITPGQTTYSPGARVSLDPQVVDGYGNRLGQIGCREGLVLSHVVVSGPKGGSVYEGDCWWLWTSLCTFSLASDAAEGSYEVEWILDTGPLQGVLHATTYFSVEGSPVTSTPTKTATATAMSTWTPTSTVTLTPTATPTSTPTPITPYAWKLYLPLILKETP